MKKNTPYMEYIDLFDCLELEDYYRSDSHWRQERIPKAAERLGEAMGVSQWLTGEYEKKLAGELTGSYLREEENLPVETDELWYLDSETLEQCSVYHYLDGSRTPVYTLEKKNDWDAYGIFLSGTDPILTIENPEAESGKELILFRDSFASSLAPLLAEAYQKITLIDIRYVRSDALGNYLTFEDQDVLFLYSTLILNNSVMLR